MFRLITLLLLVACGSDLSRECRVAGASQLQIEQDEYGFVESDKCDSLLLSALISSAGYAVDISAAEDDPGHWYRRPLGYAECYASGESRSTISRDQLLGLYWHIWAHQDLGMANRLWAYGQSHFWRMGEGRLGGADTVMNPAMISTLAQMIYRMGGRSHKERLLPVIWSMTTEPGQLYRNRLVALHLGLRRELYGNVGLQADRVLGQLRQTWPDNPLFAWAAGNTCNALGLATNGTIPSGVHNSDEYVYEKIFVLGRLRG